MPNNGLSEAELRKCFDKYDEDGGGTVSMGELSMLLKDVGLPASAVHTEFAEADKDGSGSLDFDEFAIYFEAFSKRRAKEFEFYKEGMNKWKNDPSFRAQLPTHLPRHLRKRGSNRPPNLSSKRDPALRVVAHPPKTWFLTGGTEPYFECRVRLETNFFEQLDGRLPLTVTLVYSDGYDVPDQSVLDITSCEALDLSTRMGTIRVRVTEPSAWPTHRGRGFALRIGALEECQGERVAWCLTTPVLVLAKGIQLIKTQLRAEGISTDTPDCSGINPLGGEDTAAIGGLDREEVSTQTLTLSVSQYNQRKKRLLSRIRKSRMRAEARGIKLGGGEKDAATSPPAAKRLKSEIAQGTGTVFEAVPASEGKAAAYVTASGKTMTGKFKSLSTNKHFAKPRVFHSRWRPQNTQDRAAIFKRYNKFEKRPRGKDNPEKTSFAVSGQKAGELTEEEKAAEEMIDEDGDGIPDVLQGPNAFRGAKKGSLQFCFKNALKLTASWREAMPVPDDSWYVKPPEEDQHSWKRTEMLWLKPAELKIAAFYMKEKLWSRAAQALRQCLLVQEIAFGAMHQVVGTTLGMQAEVCLRTGQLFKAFESAERFFTIRADKYNVHDKEYGEALGRYVDVLLRQRYFDDAEKQRLAHCEQLEALLLAQRRRNQAQGRVTALGRQAEMQRLSQVEAARREVEYVLVCRARWLMFWEDTYGRQAEDRRLMIIEDDRSSEKQQQVNFLLRVLMHRPAYEALYAHARQAEATFACDFWRRVAVFQMLDADSVEFISELKGIFKDLIDPPALLGVLTKQMREFFRGMFKVGSKMTVDRKVYDAPCKLVTEGLSGLIFSRFKKTAEYKMLVSGMAEQVPGWEQEYDKLGTPVLPAKNIFAPDTSHLTLEYEPPGTYKPEDSDDDDGEDENEGEDEKLEPGFYIQYQHLVADIHMTGFSVNSFTAPCKLYFRETFASACQVSKMAGLKFEDRDMKMCQLRNVQRCKDGGILATIAIEGEEGEDAGGVWEVLSALSENPQLLNKAIRRKYKDYNINIPKGLSIQGVSKPQIEPGQQKYVTFAEDEARKKREARSAKADEEEATEADKDGTIKYYFCSMAVDVRGFQITQFDEAHRLAYRKAMSGLTNVNTKCVQILKTTETRGNRRLDTGVQVVTRIWSTDKDECGMVAQAIKGLKALPENFHKAYAKNLKLGGCAVPEAMGAREVTLPEQEDAPDDFDPLRLDPNTGKDFGAAAKAEAERLAKIDDDRRKEEEAMKKAAEASDDDDDAGGGLGGGGADLAAGSARAAVLMKNNRSIMPNPRVIPKAAKMTKSQKRRAKNRSYAMDGWEKGAASGQVRKRGEKKPTELKKSRKQIMAERAAEMKAAEEAAEAAEAAAAAAAAAAGVDGDGGDAKQAEAGEEKGQL